MKKKLGQKNWGFRIFSVITFYPKYLFNGQLGRFWFKITLFSLLFQLIILKIKMRSPISEMQLIKRSDLKRPSDIQWRGTLYFLLLSLFVPLIVLTMDVSKSTVVGSIMVMPILWIIMWGYLYLDSQSKLSKSTETLLTIFAVFLLLMSFLYHLIKLNHHKSANEYEELGAITTMYLNIGDYARAHHWTEIRLSVDQVCDYIPIAIESTGNFF